MTTPDSLTQSRLVGKLLVAESVTMRESYETAAWFRDHKVFPGEYAVYAKPNGHGQLFYAAVLSTQITDAYLGSMYGGVAIGQDTASPKEIGRASSYTVVSYPLTLIPFDHLPWASFVPSIETV